MRERLDGRAKVTGARVYGADFRPGDPEVGWPAGYHHALILRHQRPGLTFDGIDLEGIPEAIRPHHVVTADDMTAAGVTNTAGMLAKTILLPRGQVADHVGQPVAIAYLAQGRNVRRLREWLAAKGHPLIHGQPAEPRPLEEQDVRAMLSPLLGVGHREPGRSIADVQYVRIAGAPPEEEDEFSFVACPDHKQRANEMAQRVEALARAEGAVTIERSFSTSVNDPMFMELESGLAWLDRTDPTRPVLRLLAGTQSPAKDREALITLMKTAPHQPSVDLRALPPGGGFGGRDLSSFPLYLAVAALFSDRPVRLTFDRPEQFQAGIKRHASAMTARMHYLAGAQGDTRVLRAYAIRGVFDGGGTDNLTGAVVGLAALQAAGPYDWPRTAIRCEGRHTHGATAGSMRGFGIPQVTFAVESMIDEVAALVQKDAIALRREQLLAAGKRDVTGYRLRHHVGIEELCALAAEEPLWKERTAVKADRDTTSLAYGVGFACCMQSFGTSNDAVYAAVELTEAGPRVVSAAVDMGQGSQTALALATEEVLGRAAVEVVMGQDAAFAALELRTTKEPPTAWNETLKLGNAMSASITAFFHLHAVRQAAEVLFDTSIREAALALWGVGAASPRWREGLLCSDDLRPLSWGELVEASVRLGNPTGAMVHTFFQGEYATAEFPIGDRTIVRPIDALGLRTSETSYRPIRRVAQHYPAGDHLKSRRSLYAAAGHLVAVEVNRRTGRVAVVDAVTFLDPGKVHHEALLRGQVEGGFVMGLGMALHEEIAAPLAGVTPDWNLHRYQVPRAKHVPLGRLGQLRLVPYEPSDGSPIVHKGVAEATMSTVPPAVANAIAHAIGRRIHRLPIRPRDVRAVLSTDGGSTHA